MDSMWPIVQDVCIFHTLQSPWEKPEDLERKNVEHGGEATNAQYTPLCNFVSMLWCVLFLKMSMSSTSTPKPTLLNSLCK